MSSESRATLMLIVKSDIDEYHYDPADVTFIRVIHSS
jgi:hypothetical protein